MKDKLDEKLKTPKEKTEEWSTWFGILFLITGVVLFFLPTYETINRHDYLFNIAVDSLEKVQLQNFQMYYDFNKNIGQMNFSMTCTNCTKNVIIYFPNELEITEINWVSEHGLKYREGQDYSKIYDEQPYKQQSILILENKNNYAKEYWSKIEINFNGTLYPNAKFELESDEEIKLVVKGGRKVFFNINIGDKYVCDLEPCKESPNADLTFHNLDSMLSVATNGETLSHPIFYINYDKEENKILKFLNKISFLQLGIAILLQSLLPSIIYKFSKRKNTEKFLKNLNTNLELKAKRKEIKKRKVQILFNRIKNCFMNKRVLTVLFNLLNIFLAALLSALISLKIAGFNINIYWLGGTILLILFILIWWDVYNKPERVNDRAQLNRIESNTDEIKENVEIIKKEM